MKRDIDIGHNMKHLFQVLFLLLFCFACNEKKEQKPKDFIEIDMVPIIEGEAKKMPLQEWAKSVRFIPLETNDDILIKHIEDVFQRGDTLLVYHTGRLSLFDISICGCRYSYAVCHFLLGELASLSYLADVVFDRNVVHVEIALIRDKSIGKTKAL